jgi:hypothetical protein
MHHIQQLSTDVSNLQRAMHAMTMDYRAIQVESQIIRRETNDKFDQFMKLFSELQGDTLSAKSEPSALSTDLSNGTIPDDEVIKIPASVAPTEQAPAPLPATNAPSATHNPTASSTTIQTSTPTDAKYLKAIMENITEKDLTLPSFHRNLRVGTWMSSLQ